jgi:hypothetical protein
MNASKYSPERYTSCPLCDRRVRGQTADGTPSDVILCHVYGNSHPNLITFLRSLRSTGSRCTVVMFHVEGYWQSLSAEEFAAVNSCGIVWANLGAYMSHHPLQWTDARFIVGKLFLARFQWLFDRVIMVDAFDTWFQADPFRKEFPRDVAKITVENDTISNDGLNIAWVRCVDREFSPEYYADKPVINAGLIYGQLHPMLSLFVHYAVVAEFQKVIHCIPIDQALLSTMFYRGRLGQGIALDRTGENMISSTKWSYKLVETGNEQYMMPVSGGNIPTTLHQYDRSCPVHQFIKNTCPPLGAWHRTPFAPGIFVYQPCS